MNLKTSDNKMQNKMNKENNQPKYVLPIPEKSCKDFVLSSQIPSDEFNLRNTTCCIKNPFSDPQGARFKVFGREKHYSKYECRDNSADNVYRFMIMGDRHPVPCDISQPFVTYDAKNDTVDFMASCDDPKYMGYNRNGRYEQSIFSNNL